MSYEFKKQLSNGNYQYQVTIDMFRDCKNSTVAFDDVIKLGVHIDNDDNDIYRKYNFTLLSKSRVDPPGSAFCDFYPKNVCIERGFYQGMIELQPNSGGYHLTFVRCCRNVQNNLVDDEGTPFQGQTFYGYIPDPSLKNSSPIFSGVPSPFMCNLDTNQFLFNAYDKDGDSLVYKIGMPFQGGSPSSTGNSPDPPPKLKLPIDAVQYRPGYSMTTPFGSSGHISVNRSTGFTELYAPTPGSYVVAVEVTEYRNGKYIGTVRLDMQILVLDCKGNNKPKVRSLTGDYFEIEVGEELCVPFLGTDEDDDNVKLVGIGELFEKKPDDEYPNIPRIAPPYASLPDKVGYKMVQSDLCWTPSCDHDRDDPYLVFVKVTDDGCPEKFAQTEIQIKVNPFLGNENILGDDVVCKSSTHTYRAETQKPNSTFWWEVIGGQIVSTDSTGPSIDVKWSPTATKGQIRSVEISQYGCPADTVVRDIDLMDIPPANNIIGPLIVCEGTIGVNYSVTDNPGNTYEWVAPGLTFTASNHTASVDFPTKGTYRIGLIETNTLGCPGDTNFADVQVIRPEPLILGPTSICPHRSGIAYEVLDPAAGSSYQWSVIGGTQASGGNSAKITVNWGGVGVGTVSVVETDQYGCQSFPTIINIDKSHNLKGQQPIGDNSVCEGDLEEYFVYESKGSVYAWDVTNGARQDTDSQARTSVIWGSSGLGRIGVQERSYDSVNMLPCLSPWVYLDVTINPTPTANDIAGEYSMCEGDNEFTYTLSGFAGSSYEWRVNGSPDNVTGQGTNQIRMVWDQPGTYKIEVRETTQDSCVGLWIDSTVTVHPTPDATEIKGPGVVCGPFYANQGYKVSGLPNSTFEWNITGGAITSNDGDSITVLWDQTDFGQLWVIETSENGCVGDTLRLTVFISDLEVDIKKVSVGFPDDRMYIKWKNELNTPIEAEYELQKRDAADIGSWRTIAVQRFTDYLELDLNTDQNAFEYRIRTTDLCGNEILSDVHTNVLLKGTQIDNSFDVTLDFTEYLGWESGVDRYELMLAENGSGDFKSVGVYNAGEVINYTAGLSSYQLCFRVKAFENVGEFQESWSNELCFTFTPNVFIPTAFSPNGDNINEEFFTVNSAIKTYRLQIYNRWGELLFETDDPNGRWNGISRGNKQQMGVYLAVVTFTDFQGKAYEKSATFTLLK